MNKNEILSIFENCGIKNATDIYGQNLDKVCQEYEELTFKTASNLHNSWLQNYAKNNGGFDSNGKTAPRWKKIKDQEFLEKLNAFNLPDNIRVTEEAFEIDIANTKFENLSADWQKENLEAAKIAVALLFRAKVDNSITREDVGNIIHNEWLKRNDWALTDPVLSLPFDKLPDVEKDKDIDQFIVAKNVYKQHVKENQAGMQL